MHKVPDSRCSNWHCKLAGLFAYMHTFILTNSFRDETQASWSKSRKSFSLRLGSYWWLAPNWGYKNMWGVRVLLKGLCKMLNVDLNCEVWLISILLSSAFQMLLCNAIYNSILSTTHKIPLFSYQITSLSPDRIVMIMPFFCKMLCFQSYSWHCLCNQ